MNRIYIFCATKFEAKPFLDEFELKPDRRDNLLSLFVRNLSISNSTPIDSCPLSGFTTSDVLLVISGTGQIASAGAVARTMTLLPPNGKDILLNIGCCAGPRGLSPSDDSAASVPVSAAADASFGTFFRINSITSEADGRPYYPDILDAHPFPEAPLTSGYTIAAEAPETLYDMEAAAIFQTARPFFTCERMVFLKCPTDCGGGDFAELKSLAEKYYHPGETVFSYIRSLLKNSENAPAVWPAENAERNVGALADDSSSLADLFYPSETMQHKINNLMNYAGCAGIDAKKIILEMKEWGVLPVKSRKEGKQALVSLRTKILERVCC